jgi:ribosomal protein L29
MKGNARKELHTKSKEELLNMVKTVRKEIAELIIKKSSNKDKNVHSIGQKKKELAKILTVLKEKETNA